MQNSFNCYKCGAPNSLGSPYCKKCGEKFHYSCPVCNAKISANDRNCQYCGNILTWSSKQQQVENKERKSSGLSPQNKSIFPLLLGIILILVVTGAGIYFLMKLFEKPQQPVVVENITSDKPVERVIADTYAPQISDIKVISINYNSVEIQWNTDEPSTSQVYYREKSDYSQPTSVKEAMVKQHSMVLADLKTKTSYFYQVRSMDAAGNVAMSEEKTFDIGLQPGTTRIEVLETRWSSEEHPPETKTYIKGQIRNSGDTVLNIRDIEVIITIEVAGKSGFSDVIASLDSYPVEIRPGNVHGFSALVPNGTSPHFSVNARVIE